MRHAGMGKDVQKTTEAGNTILAVGNAHDSAGHPG
jgi:hypothetical protein